MQQLRHCTRSNVLLAGWGCSAATAKWILSAAWDRPKGHAVAAEVDRPKHAPRLIPPAKQSHIIGANNAAAARLHHVAVLLRVVVRLPRQMADPMQQQPSQQHVRAQHITATHGTRREPVQS